MCFSQHVLFHSLTLHVEPKHGYVVQEVEKKRVHDIGVHGMDACVFVYGFALVPAPVDGYETLFGNTMLE
jgi:hypothetical protein